MEDKWTRASFEAWWTVILSAIRDLAALAVGVWILVFRTDAPASLQGIGFLLLTASAAGAAKAAIRQFVPPTDDSTRR